MAQPERPDRAEPDSSRSASTRPARTRSISVTLLVLLLVPLLALVALWAFVASLTLGNRIRFQHYETVTNTTGPGFGVLDTNLYAERALTVAWLGSARRTPETALLAVRQRPTRGWPRPGRSTCPSTIC